MAWHGGDDEPMPNAASRGEEDTIGINQKQSVQDIHVRESAIGYP
jgi:hypothetical protein